MFIGSCLISLSPWLAAGPTLASLAELPPFLPLPHALRLTKRVDLLPVSHLFAQLESIGPWAKKGTGSFSDSKLVLDK